MNADHIRFDEIIKPIEEQMIKIVTRLIHDPDQAADVMQDVLMKIWKNLPRISSHPNPQAYILRVAITTAHDALRKRRRQSAREEPLNEGLLPHASTEVNDSEARQAQLELILSCIEQLPKKQATTVLLRAINDYSFNQIANTLGCAEATAYSHFSKGLARIREILNISHNRKDHANVS